ncbi:MAG: LysM peptidoglycan-binding domain-containing protein [Firmicutes bacterium]|nr:LysM peptidoglycan-binding domain-containing protein [Bacillota bacterium]
MPSKRTPNKQFLVLVIIAILCATAVSVYVSHRTAPIMTDPGKLEITVDSSPWESLVTELQEELSELNQEIKAGDEKILEHISQFQTAAAGMEAELLEQIALLQTALEEVETGKIQKQIRAENEKLLEQIALLQPAENEGELEKIKAQISRADEKLFQIAALLETEKENTADTVFPPPEDEVIFLALRLKPGDNVWNLVSRFVTSPDPGLIKKILDLNDISDPRKLTVGSYISIPLRKTPQGYELQY